MIKKIIKKIIPQKTKKISKKHHPLRDEMLSHAAERVIRTLSESGFEAYVVGGAVRDLLCQREPKDFDVATDATPNEVRRLFRRSRIIGRRFPIVHVPIGYEIIEVTTFRSGDVELHNSEGRIMRDNVYGTRAEDSSRRDFTCNALYYDPLKEILIDDHNGWKDIQAKKLVMIGDPVARFREDPVRILRAIRLSAKLGFKMADNIQAAITQCQLLLKNEPIARLFDEITKELLCGYSVECLNRLRLSNISDTIHPLYRSITLDENSQQWQFLQIVLKNTDQRVQEDLPISIGFILAAILWQDVRQLWQEHKATGTSPEQSMIDAVKQMRQSMETGFGIPNRFISIMREIWALQPHLENLRGKRPYRVLRREYFRSAYDFYVLRTQCNDASASIADWWKTFQAASEHQREEMIQQLNAGKSKPKNKRKRRKKSPKKTDGD